MRRLGYSRYVAQGGDVGAGVTDALGRQAPDGLVGIHTNLLVTALGGPQPTDTEPERVAAAALATFRASGFAYFLEQATRPQTIGYALLDSPVALAAWMLDHDTDSYLKISRAFVDGHPSGNLTRDHVLDNITLYWVTGTGASAARSYWENYGVAAGEAAAGRTPPEVTVPVGFTTFPGEIWRSPRSWVEKAYPTLTYFNEVDKGGHFAAWEELAALRGGDPGRVQTTALTRVTDRGARSVVQGARVSVVVVGSRTEADLIVGLLESEGVAAVVSSDDAGGQEPQLQLQGVHVVVSSSDAASARRILAEAVADRPGDDD